VDVEKYQKLAEVVRSGFVESIHYGSVVGVGPDGSVALSGGAFADAILPRSLAKPLQALACLQAGADLAGPSLAIAAGSHIGEPGHIAIVRDMLAAAGLDEAALRCPASLPGHQPTRDDLIRRGVEGASVYMNCSGKHAAMIAACVASGWPTESYMDAQHPLQQLVCAVVSDTAGEPAEHAAVDGCGVPIFAISPVGLARAARCLVRSAPGTAARAVVDAMRAHPEFVGGSDNHVDTDLMRMLPGLVAKSGAEGTLLLATADGHAVVVKVIDGGPRATAAIGLAALEAMGVDVGLAAALRTVAVQGPTRIVDAVRVTI
jgi:L-asparaginase II